MKNIGKDRIITGWGSGSSYGDGQSQTGSETLPAIAKDGG